MPEFLVKQQGNDIWLVYQLQPAERIDGIAFRMLANNRLSNLAPLSIEESSNSSLLRYNMGNRLPLSHYFEQIMTRNKMLQILLSITEIILEGEEYLLLEEQYVLDMRYIFINPDDYSADMVYFPVKNVPGSPYAFFDFIRSVTTSVRIDTSENTNYAMAISRFLSAKDPLSIASFKRLIADLLVQGGSDAVLLPTLNNQIPISQSQSWEQASQNVITTPANTDFLVNSPQNNMQNNMQQPIQNNILDASLLNNNMNNNVQDNSALQEQPVQTMPQRSATQSMVPPQQSFFATMPEPQNEALFDTTAISIDEKTLQESKKRSLFGGNKKKKNNKKDSSILPPADTNIGTSAPNTSIAVLVRQSTGEIIPLNKPKMSFGKSQTMDYTIDNPAISRSHADFIQQNGSYYIKDNNSTNHTYINGIMAEPEQINLLKDGNRLLLANEKFTFELQNY